MARAISPIRLSFENNLMMLIKLMITLLNKSALAPNKTAKTIPSGISAIAMRVIPLIISTTELTVPIVLPPFTSSFSSTDLLVDETL